MPEPYQPKRGTQPLMLSVAAKNGSLIKASCVGCSKPRWYLPHDMIKLFSDIPAMNLSRLMRCEQCKSFLYVEIITPTADERQAIRLRRLDKVWWVRRVSWRQE